MGCATSLGSSSQAGQGRFQFRGGWRKAGIRFYPTGPVPFLPPNPPSLPHPHPAFPAEFPLFPDSLRFSGAASFSLPGSDFPTPLPGKMTITVQAGLSHTKLIPMSLVGTKVASEGAAVPREDGAASPCEGPAPPCPRGSSVCASLRAQPPWAPPGTAPWHCRGCQPLTRADVAQLEGTVDVLQPRPTSQRDLLSSLEKS